MISVSASLMVWTFAGIANAATFSIQGGTDFTLGDDFDLTEETGLQSGDTVQFFNSKYDEGANSTGFNIQAESWFGLSLDGAPAQLQFTYLGSETTEENRFVLSDSPDEPLFNNQSSEFGDTTTKTVSGDGLIRFSFVNENSNIPICSEQGVCTFYGDTLASNLRYMSKGVRLAFYQESATSVLVLFDDGDGEFDMDDMAIRISVVPLPPALLLFAAALAGLGWLSRQRKDPTL